MSGPPALDSWKDQQLDARMTYRFFGHHSLAGLEGKSPWPNSSPPGADGWGLPLWPDAMELRAPPRLEGCYHRVSLRKPLDIRWRDWEDEVVRTTSAMG